VKGISDVPKRIEIQTRIARDYLLLYQAFNDTNDSNRTIRREIQQEIISAASYTGHPVIQATIMVELMMYHTGHLRTEADRTDGKQIWAQAIDVCRKITKYDDQVVLFAQLIVAKNMLENPNFQRRVMPLFTKESNPSTFDETDSLINECLALVNSLESEEQQGKACAHLAMALIQIGRTRAAQALLDRTLEIAENVSDHQALISMLLSTIPALKAMNSAGTIPTIYRMAIDAIAHEFAGKPSNIDLYVWRMRDSEIEMIVRSQMENGFVDDAVESVNRLNEPVLRERLLRTAAYIYLDQGNIDRAELIVQRLTVKEIQNSAVQHVQTLQRRSELRVSPKE
jgi:tetratricopeptide (TPR) repeat protein